MTINATTIRLAFLTGIIALTLSSGTAAASWTQAAGQYGSAATIQEILVWNNTLYGGTCGASDGGLLLKYNTTGAQWDLAAPQLSGQDYIYELIVYGGNLYAGTRDNGAPALGGRLFMYDEPNDQWVQKAGNLNNQEAIVTLHEFGGSLYGGTAHGARLFKWDDISAWTQVTGQYGSELEIYRLFSYNNIMYASTANGGLLLRWHEANTSWTQQCPQAHGQNHIGAGFWMGNTLYAGTQVNGNLFSWTEGASTWTQEASQYGSETHIYTTINHEGDIYGGTHGTGLLLKWDGVSAWTVAASQYASEIWIPDLVTLNGAIYGCTEPNGLLLKYVSPYSPDTGSYTYTKKKELPIYNANTTYTITNYSIPINVTWESGMNSDFSDIIVKNENTGVWLEGCVDRKRNGNWADFWFKADTLLSGWNNATFYLYFGSASPKEQVCSCGRTFPEHNTFESGIEGFDHGTRDGTYVYDGSYSYLMPSNPVLGTKTTLTEEPEPQIVEYEYYMPAGSTGNPFFGYYGFDGGIESITSGLGAINSLEWSYYQTYSTIAWIDTGVVPTLETWHTMSYVHYPDDTYAILHDGTMAGSGFYRNEVQDTHLRFTKFDGHMVYVDNIRTRKWNTDPPSTGALGTTEDVGGGGQHTPPNPTNLQHTTGNFWVRHSWSPGVGTVTDSYNVRVNSVWHNTTTNAFWDNAGMSAHGWSNITVYAYNSSGTGTLSSASISQNTQIPNNPIAITNASDWNGDVGENVYVDYDATDADSDTPTFSCSRLDLFTDFNSVTGIGNWAAGANGTYSVGFGVSDGYGSTSNYTMTIQVGDVPPSTLRGTMDTAAAAAYDLAGIMPIIAIAIAILGMLGLLMYGGEMGPEAIVAALSIVLLLVVLYVGLNIISNIPG